MCMMRTMKLNPGITKKGQKLRYLTLMLDYVVLLRVDVGDMRVK